MFPFKTILATTLAATLAALLPLSALAQDGLHLKDPFAHVTPQSGAIYLLIENHSDTDDTLLGATSDAAAMVMPMAEEKKDDGTMSMVNLTDGLALPAGGTVVLQPGQDHLMLMGLKAPLKDGDMITVTLNFAKAGAVTLTMPVTSKRMTAPAAVDTPYDAETGMAATGSAAPAATMGQMSVDPASLDPDQRAIVAQMKAQFEKPDAPLSVNPVVVMGDDAIASWAQGPMAGRALLHRAGDAWAIVLCAGPDLRTADFLARHGVANAAMLSQMFNQAEDGLGADRVAAYSSFDGVVDMSKGSN